MCIRMMFVIPLTEIVLNVSGSFSKIIGRVNLDTPVTASWKLLIQKLEQKPTYDALRLHVKSYS